MVNLPSPAELAQQAKDNAAASRKLVDANPAPSPGPQIVPAPKPSPPAS